MLRKLRPFPIRCLAAWLGGFLSLSLWAGNVLFPPTPLLSVVVAQVDSAETQAFRQAAADQLVFRDRKQQVALRRVEDIIRSGNVQTGLLYLKQLIDQGQDSFVRTSPQAPLSSFKQEIDRIFNELSVEQLKQYEQWVGPDARRLLEQARQAGTPALYVEVSKRYYYTSEGFQATNWLASRSLSQGHFLLAARTWEKLLKSPVHIGRVQPIDLFKAGLAFQLGGDIQKADSYFQKLGDRPVRIRGQLVKPASVRSELSLASSQNPQFTDWLVPFGDPDSTPAAIASAPYSHAKWSRSNSRREKDPVSNLASEWAMRQKDRTQSIAVANLPLAISGQLIVRDYEGISSRDIATGAEKWFYRSPVSLLQTLYHSPGNKPTTGNRRSARSTSYFDIDTAFARNSTLGTLTCDGQKVFAVEGMDLTRMMPRNPASLPQQKLKKVGSETIFRGSNRLIALNLASDGNDSEQGQVPEWTLGGIALPEKQVELAGHFFLGPPLPVDGRLYVLTEFDRQLNLIAIHPNDGRVLWHQGIGFVNKSIDLDSRRYGLACTPVYSDGVLVCPTQLGILVAVEATTGRLLWAYYYGDENLSKRPTRWPYNANKSIGHSGFAGTPRIQGNRVVYCPRQSSKIHCVNLSTGEADWTIDRGDTEYIAAVTEDQILVVGSRTCRAFDLQSGEQKWSTGISGPSGLGVHVGNTYLVPLEEGRVVALDVQTGHEVGYSQTLIDDAGENPQGANSVVVPGNLIVHDELVVSVGIGGVSVFPQSVALLNRIQKTAKTIPLDEQSLLKIAELELTLGELGAAERHFAQLLAANLTASVRSRVSLLLQEVLYLQLQDKPEEEQAILARLDRLAELPDDRARYLIRLAGFQLRENDFAGLLSSSDEFSKLKLVGLFPIQDAQDSSLLSVSRESWIPSLIGRARLQFGGEELQKFKTQIENRQQQLLAEENADGFKQFLAIYSNWPQAIPIRLRLAEKMVEAGNFQKAELLLLQDRNSSNPQVAAVATVRLLQLWDRLELFNEAAGLLTELHTKYKNVLLQDGLTGSQFVAQFPKAGFTWKAYQNRFRPKWNVRQVSISEQLWKKNDPERVETFKTYSRRFETPRTSTFQLVGKGTGKNSNLTIVDKHAGRVVGKIQLNTNYSYPVSSMNAHIGHFFPLGGTGEMHGISLIESAEEKPFWSLRPSQKRRSTSLLKVGPAGPQFCSFQSKSELFVVDPATGKTLWKRSGLAPNSGLLTDHYSGLFGDEQVLVMFESNRRSYTAFRTLTGEIIRKGTLDIELRNPRRVIGRNLFYMVTTIAGKRMRVWDSVYDRIIFDEPARSTYLATTVLDAENELAVVLPGNRLRIFNAETGKILLNVLLSEKQLQNLSYIRVSRDAQRYFVNFQYQPRFIWMARSSLYADTFLPRLDVQGDLYVFNKNTGQQLWKRTLPQRSILRLPEYDLPFLITISRERGRQKNNTQSLLVEAIDIQTGETLGSAVNLFPDRLVQMSVDRDRGVVLLHGLKNEIRLDFGPQKQRFNFQDETL